MRAKPLSMNDIRYKMLIRHDSRFEIRQVKSLHVRDFSRTILNSIHDNSHYIEEDILCVYRHDQIMKKNPIPRTCLPGASLQYSLSSQSKLARG
jgi:hypothetical protein